MTKGDPVRVYPEGAPEKAATAVVVVGGSAGSIAVTFGDLAPNFVISGGGIAYDMEHGIMMLASRVEGNLWKELFHGDHFVIEEVPHC